MEYVVQGGYLQLPYNMGSIFIERNKPSYFYTDEYGDKHPRNSMINWKETQKLRKKKEPDKTRDYWLKFENRDKYVVLFTNFHTDGYMYAIRFRYDVLHTIKSAKQLFFYSFKPQVPFKQKLGNFLKTNKKIPTYYDKFNNSKFNYRAFEKKVARINKRRQRERYRKYLDSIQTNRTETER